MSHSNTRKTFREILKQINMEIRIAMQNSMFGIFQYGKKDLQKCEVVHFVLEKVFCSSISPFLWQIANSVAMIPFQSIPLTRIDQLVRERCLVV